MYIFSPAFTGPYAHLHSNLSFFSLISTFPFCERFTEVMILAPRTKNFVFALKKTRPSKPYPHIQRKLASAFGSCVWTESCVLTVPLYVPHLYLILGSSYMTFLPNISLQFCRLYLNKADFLKLELFPMSDMICYSAIRYYTSPYISPTLNLQTSKLTLLFRIQNSS